jgi:hypothetical protein
MANDPPTVRTASPGLSSHPPFCPSCNPEETIWARCFTALSTVTPTVRTPSQ